MSLRLSHVVVCSRVGKTRERVRTRGHFLRTRTRALGLGLRLGFVEFERAQIRTWTRDFC